MTPETLFLPERFAFRYSDGVEFQMERFEDGRDGLKVELTVLHVNGATPTLIDFGKWNTGAPTTRKQLAKTFHEKHPRVSEQDFAARLQEIAFLAVQEWRNGGEPFVDLATIVVDRTKPAMLLPPLIPAAGTVLDYGNGEAGKSLFVMAQALTVATGCPFLGLAPRDIGRVLYLDWEDNGQQQRERMDALCAGLNVPVPEDSIIFRRMDRSIFDSEDRIKNAAAEYEVALIIADSIGMAIGTDPSDVDAVVKALNVLARTGKPAIGIHHLSAEQAYGKASKDKPYGSIYARNMARLQWLVERDVEEGGALFLTNTKSNGGPRAPRMAFEAAIEFDGLGHMTTARYTAIDAAGYRESVGEETNYDRVLKALEGQKSPTKTLADRSGVSEANVRVVMQRDAGRTFGSEKRGRENWWFVLSHLAAPEW